ncbi:flagellar basal body rod protein FlgF [Ameyamaea chiangmaiensis NBRC 103196]|uniref:Flagellar basal-body rod protein FlgF n=1 Tax=Ameyamaea chiangmaiensis TaxID=442969 RepID=A0A850P3N1_9PROT|nr:flagellar basal-body rod protein FlgF [Ameyamaea chiangmaiensis]MBS4075854.1 flagellar basal-body rod protein FlgF [Ameyamaea chiangmaiensis]NVN39275.1 flagellar basal-body rod protein FlgF [Ameyamaea chiangmaiensis]GBQ63987.1 flagellar basal body rod protein FlgF [Ameyamaea chiangmaiensis NBRC 103196]
MDNPTYIALSRLDTADRALSMVATNIANASTSGYKAEHGLFSDYLVRQDSATTPQGGSTYQFTQDLATYRDQSQGPMQATGNPLDLALGGSGYFSVQTTDGVRLTRAGRFQRLSDGTIADESGNALLDRLGQPVRLQPTDKSVTISADGTLTTESGVAAYIGVVEADDTNQLLAQGNRLFKSRSGTRQSTTPKIVQGMVEGSTVQAMAEMTHMLQIQRDYTAVMRFVEDEGKRQQNAIDKIAQVMS